MMQFLLPAALSNYFQQRRALRGLRSLKLYAIVDEHLNKSCLSGFSEKKKKELRDGVGSEVSVVLTANDGFMVLRKKIVDAAFTFANLQVLALRENERGPPLRDGPYLSGELHHKILEAVPFNEELKEFAWKLEVTAGDLIDFCNVRCAIGIMYLNCFNVLRVLFKDIDESKDWFRPFIRSMLIWAEDTQRKNLGLPSLLGNDLDGLRFSLFGNFVEKGFPNPYFEWATCDAVKGRQLDLSGALGPDLPQRQHAGPNRDQIDPDQCIRACDPVISP
jgi:hypothetical protein